MGRRKPSPANRRPIARLSRSVHGFSLVELAIVLVVLGLLSRAALVPMASLIDRSRTRATAQLLEQVRESLIGHAITRGYLPCPAPEQPQRPAGVGIAAPWQQTVGCARSEGVLPAVLGIDAATGPAGGIVDAWGRPIRYAVSLYSSPSAGNPATPDWVTPGELPAIGVASLQANLVVCRQAARGRCTDAALQATGIVAVVWSSGEDASDDGEQRENNDKDTVFAAAPPSAHHSAPFDDQLVWLSQLEMSYWLLRSGWLP